MMWKVAADVKTSNVRCQMKGFMMLGEIVGGYALTSDRR